MTTPSMPTAPEAPVKKPKGKGLGIASLVLGILGAILCWIPFIGIIGIILGFVGAVLGAVGFFVSHRWMSLAGFVLSLVAIIGGFASTASGVSQVNKQLNTPPTVQEQNSGNDQGAGGAGDTYAYTVTGSGTVSYGTFSGSGMSMSQTTSNGQWSKKITVTNKSVFFTPSLTVTGNGGTVTCQISHNGKVSSHNSASGQFGTANCSG
ncbi:MAG: hypothetical protein ACRDMV_10845 [Streptosporangiales bacterium]